MDTEGLVLVWPYFEACFRLYASFAKYQRSAHYRVFGHLILKTSSNLGCPRVGQSRMLELVRFVLHLHDSLDTKVSRFPLGS